jgi:biopolymer transport protein ExbD
MSSLCKPRRRLNEDNSLIPLINIVFLILIFFMVAGHIDSRDRAAFTAPESSQQNRLDDAPLKILLAADKTVWVNEEKVTGDLLPHLRSRGLNAQSQVILKVDAQLQAPILDPVLTALQSLGIQRLKLVTIAPRS